MTAYVATPVKTEQPTRNASILTFTIFDAMLSLTKQNRNVTTATLNVHNSGWPKLVVIIADLITTSHHVYVLDSETGTGRGRVIEILTSSLLR